MSSHAQGYRKYCLACFLDPHAAATKLLLLWDKTTAALLLQTEKHSQHKAACLSEVLSDPMLEPGKSKSKDTNIAYLFDD